MESPRAPRRQPPSRSVRTGRGRPTALGSPRPPPERRGGAERLAAGKEPLSQRRRCPHHSGDETCGGRTHNARQEDWDPSPPRSASQGLRRGSYRLQAATREWSSAALRLAKVNLKGFADKSVVRHTMKGRKVHRPFQTRRGSKATANSKQVTKQTEVVDALPDSKVVDALPDSKLVDALPDSKLVDALPDSKVKTKQAKVMDALPEDSGVNSLPDETLVFTFSMLSDGATLLDVLPLVCKRWCRLARDPASWAGVQLSVCDYDYVKSMDDTRILLHAPAARSFVLEPWDSYIVHQPHDRLRSALRRSRVVVKHRVSVPEKGWEMCTREPEAWGRRSGAPAEAMARFLARHRDLRELQLFLGRGDEAAILPVVATLRRLKSINLETAPGVRYAGQLAGGRLPELRSVTIRAQCPRDYRDPHPPYGLLGDLVRGATALQQLRADVPQGGDRDACAALRGLDHAEFNVYQDLEGRLPPLGPAAVRAVRDAFELILQMDSSDRPTLTSAAVALCREEHARYSVKLQKQCNAVMDEFALKMPQAILELFVDGPTCIICDDTEPWDCPGRNWPRSIVGRRPQNGGRR